jgi:hypothetical protein
MRSAAATALPGPPVDETEQAGLSGREVKSGDALGESCRGVRTKLSQQEGVP